MQAEQGGQDASRVKRLEPSEDVVGQQLGEEYDVSEGELAAEVDSLISTLASEGLVRILERD